MSITNFRDIGGYETSDGRRVKKGIFYRSAPIVFKSEQEREEFTALGIRTILDLRSSQERRAQPNDQVAGCQDIHCSAISEDNMGGGNFDLAQMMRDGSISQLGHYVELIYKALPFDNPAYRLIFNLISQEETPLVFHCSAGKDRTGFAACLILKTLGVPNKTILEDYMLSNIHRREENERVLAHFPQASQAEGLLYVKESYLQSSLDAIAAQYDCFEDYLLAEYNVTPEEIQHFKDRYLE